MDRKLLSMATNIRMEIEKKFDICFLTCINKNPIYEGWAEMSRAELKQKYQQTYDSKKYNRGIRTGFIDEKDEYGILGLDIDDHNEFENFISTNNLNRDEIINTFTERTPSGSIHYYYLIDQRLKTLTVCTNFPCNKVDIRCKGGQMICYGSRFTQVMCKKKDRHRCKGTDEMCYFERKEYKVINETDINLLPESLVNIFLQKIKPMNNITKMIDTKSESNYSNQSDNDISSEDISNEEGNTPVDTNFVNEINIALQYLPIKYYDDYSEWIRIGLMLKSDNTLSDKEYFKIFNNFSQKSNKYDGNKIKKQWQDLKPNGTLHINSLFYEARKYGYEKPHDAYQKLTNGQYGHAQLFYDYHCEDIVISNGVGYVYDEKTCLWIQKDYSQIINMIPSFIQKKVRQELINNNKIIPDNEEDHKKTDTNK